MIYKDLLNKKKHKISKIFAWIFGIATIAGIVVTIVFHKQEYWWALMIGTMFLFLMPFVFFLAWNAEIGNALRTKEYLDSVKEKTLFDEILQMRIEKQLYSIIKQYGFRYWTISPKNQIPLIGFIKTKKKRILSVELFKTELKYYIGDKKTEEQDIEESEWTTIAYDDIKPNCNLSNLLEFLSGIKEREIG